MNSRVTKAFARYRRIYNNISRVGRLVVDMVKADAINSEARQARSQFVGGIVVGETTSKGEIAGQEADTLAAAIDETSVPRAHEPCGAVIEP